MKPRQFEVYDPSGNLLVSGPVATCARALGMKPSGFQSAVETPNYKKYRIVDITPETEKRQSKEWRKSVQKWDNFCTPIRERFGIPVYKGKPEVRG